MFETNVKPTQQTEELGTLCTVAQMLKLPKYEWVTNSYLRHAIFEAGERLGSGGATVPGNGLAPAIIRIGRKVLIDLNEFDRWVEGHRTHLTQTASGFFMRCIIHMGGLGADWTQSSHCGAANG